MTLAFATKFPKDKPGLEEKPTHFIEKIWAGLINNHFIGHSLKVYEDYLRKHIDQFNCDFGYDKMMINPKIHTMRSDEKNRWKKGNNIHFAINNRQPDRFQFAPILECSGIENISINTFKRSDAEFLSNDDIIIGEDVFSVEINGKILSKKEVELLSKNDGFDSVEDFFEWFNENWTGKIIHWTTFRYSPESIEVKDEQIIQTK